MKVESNVTVIGVAAAGGFSIAGSPVCYSVTATVDGKAVRGYVLDLDLDRRTKTGDEALWRAKLHPLTPDDSLTSPELKALHRAIRRALEQGLARQGSTLRDYRLPETGDLNDKTRAALRVAYGC